MSPNEVTLYPFSSAISQIPSHSYIFNKDIGISLYFISVLTSPCNTVADDAFNTFALTIPKSSGADCITVTKYLIGPSCSGFPVEGSYTSTLLNSV